MAHYDLTVQGVREHVSLEIFFCYELLKRSSVLIDFDTDVFLLLPPLNVDFA